MGMGNYGKSNHGETEKKHVVPVLDKDLILSWRVANSCGVFVVSLTTGLVVLASYKMGVSDSWSIALWLIFLVFFYSELFRARMDVRRTVRPVFERGSWLYKWATYAHPEERSSNKGEASSEQDIYYKPGLKEWVEGFISLFFAAAISAVFMIMLAFLSQVHGFWPFSIVMFVAAVLVYRSSSSSFPGRIERSNLEVHSAGRIASLLVATLSASLLISGVLSAKDTFDLLGAEVNFSNFISEHAYKKSIDAEINKEGEVENALTRPLINIYIAMDSFKLAVVHEVHGTFKESFGQKSDLFYVFYALVFIMNYLAILPLSLGLVLTSRGLSRFYFKRVRPFGEVGKFLSLWSSKVINRR